MKLINFNFKRVSCAFVALSASAGVAWASCGGTEALVLTSAARLATSAVSSLTSATTRIVNADINQTNSILAALKVVTKQISASSEKNSANIVKVSEASAAVMSDIATKELVDKVVIDFLSQGFDPCGTSTVTKKMRQAEITAQNSIPVRMAAEIDNLGGKYASPTDTLRAREAQHQRMFCTQEEVTAGACSSVGKVPGGDSNAALLFSKDTSADVVAAKNAVINTIIGLPDAPLAKSVVDTPEGQAYLLEKKKKDAFMGWAAYSLKSIQVQNEVYKDAMDERVGQYFGTPRAVEWAKDQAGQATRGVLVDLLKIQGLQLKVRERRIQDNLRIEANVSALLELENQKVNSPVTANTAKQATFESSLQKVNP